MNTKIKLAFLFTAMFIIALVITSFQEKETKVKDSEYVQEVLAQLGDKVPLNYISTNKLDSVKVKQGENLVHFGFTDPTNKSLFENKQSKHFVCTDCHNTQKEDPDLSISNPDTRLTYVAENKMKFLPGTTLFGTTNKSHWYNEDYLKKYGDLVVPARDTLQNAIQLCAVVCSQGRALDETEMEAMMHYFTSISYKVRDLKLTEVEKQFIGNALIKGTNNTEVIKIIKSKYLDFSPATFMKPQSVENRSFGKEGNAQKGKQIYELSCLTCHKEGGVTNYKLSDEQLAFKHLKYWSNTHKVFSVYDITRKGTYSKNGYKPYMPNYTKERLSDQQLEDLMKYINVMAEKGTIQKITGTPSF